MTGTGQSGRLWWYSSAPYAGSILILLVLPPFVSTYFLSMLTKVIIFAIFAISLDLILGYTGLLSLGHAAYFGVAGYTSGIFMVHLGVESVWLLLPLSVMAAGVAAGIIGYLALRVLGVYFLLITLAFGQLLSVVAVRWRNITGGTNGLIGINYPELGFSEFIWTGLSFYYFVFLCFAICYYLLHRIVHSSFGRTLVGIRENEPRMQALGINTWAHKYIAFIIAGLFAGVSGALFASFYGIMVPEHLGLMTSATGMLMVVIGSPGTLFGSVIGSVVIVLLEQFASIYAPERWPLILGVVFVISVIFLKGGIGNYLSQFWRRGMDRTEIQTG
ncbi:MAG: branched-chain amino acid ABC transporter permease [Deltaproteobacteria bacterium]|nr:branched-chain amino acid ABC transporter permease [Deltaproteobacteria bacterium]